VLEGNRDHLAAAGKHVLCSGDALDRPVAALDEHLGPAGGDDLLRRVLLEPGDYAHAGERGDHRHAVGQRIERPIRAFAEPARRGIAIQRDQQARAQGTCLVEVGDMAAMQDVEDSVREDQGPAKLAESARVADLRFERRLGYCAAFVVFGAEGLQASSVGLQYSNTFTTLRTPPVLRVISTASSASCSVTTPIR